MCTLTRRRNLKIGKAFSTLLHFMALHKDSHHNCHRPTKFVSKHWYANDRFSSADKQYGCSVHYFVRSYCFSKIHLNSTVFTALHGMQRGKNGNSVRPSVCPSVCLSVCLSVKRVHCDKTEESSVEIFISYERTFILVF